MSEPFIAEIRIFAGTFAPRGWAFCSGQLLPIAQNTALFSILGTTYGGDGRTTFGLPDLRGRAPMHPGNGPGLTPRRLGEKSGESSVALNPNQMPQHTHPLWASSGAADTGNPVGAAPANAAGLKRYRDAADLEDLASDAVDLTGAAAAHNNMQPYLVTNFIIAQVGTFPSRS